MRIVSTRSLVARRRFWAATVAVSIGVPGALLSQTGSTAAMAETRQPGIAQPAAPAAVTALDRLADPGAVLGPGWRRSADRAVAVAGDASGLHVLVADEARGYQWRTVATLGSPAVDTPQWIGQACVTGNGTRAVVVYAPSQITNSPAAMGQGAAAAVVNLVTGQVVPVRASVSIAYFDPGCGTGDTAVLTQGGWGADTGSPVTTRLAMLNADTGKVTSVVSVPGQVSSAVPYRGSIAAVYGSGVALISGTGRVRILARTTGAAFRLTPDRDGGLGYEAAAGNSVQVWRYHRGHGVLVGTARLGAVDLSQIGGQVFATGPGADDLGPLPAAWRAVSAPAYSQISTAGAMAVVATIGSAATRGRSPGLAPATASWPVKINGWVEATGKTVRFTAPVPAAVPPGLPAGPARAVPPGGPDSKASGAAGSPDPATTTWDPDRACSVPRNDPAIETYQPSDEQIQWAADQAARRNLMDARGPNLYGSGLPAYRPQQMFPQPRLDGGGSVPPQVLLGILTQESALYQASNHVIIGEAGNVEPSFDWYGDKGNYTYVDWANADCGYGIAQVTTGMCRAGYYHCASPLPYDEQLAVDVDYQANIAAGLQILVSKWNQLYKLGIKANDANPGDIENWYFALWAYNAGLEPSSPAYGNTTGCSPSPKCTDSGGNWGLGWANNPANDAYPPDRPSFLEQSSAQAPDGGSYNATWEMMHPQYWPYQEKVIGWAFNADSNWSFLKQKYVKAYDWGKWPKGTASPAIAPHTQFCTTADHCDPADVPPHSVTTRGNPCKLTGKMADHCWWHWSSSWTDCARHCGQGVFAYHANAADPRYPGLPKGYPPVCDKPRSPAVVVADTATSLPKPLGCGTSYKNGGVMTWQFGSARYHGTTTYPSKIDFHQVSAGYNGHFWFTHTIPSADPLNSCAVAKNPSLQVTGTWTPPPGLTGSVTVWVALPNVGAVTPQAAYQIFSGSGEQPYYRIIDQDYGVNGWVSLGTYDFKPGAHVALSNVNCSGEGDDIAWDAMAFVGTHKLKSNYVAMGDSYASGDGLTPYYRGSDTSADRCHRSVYGYPALIKLPGQSVPIAQQATLGGDTSFSFIACGGAKTTGITSAAVDPRDSKYYKYDKAGNTDWGQVQTPLVEGLQAKQGALNSGTTLVTLTIGGNDARFSDVLGGCVATKVNCSAHNYHLKRRSNKAVDPEPLDEFEPFVIKLVRSHLVDTYKAIHDQAPNAEIIVTGYPLLFPVNPKRGCTVGSLLGKKFTLNVSDLRMLNKFGFDLNNSIAAAVAHVHAEGVDIHFVSVTRAFMGHAICSSDPWITGLKLIRIGKHGIEPLDPNSFHPKRPGQQAFARLINGCLAGTVSC